MRGTFYCTDNLEFTALQELEWQQSQKPRRRHTSGKEQLRPCTCKGTLLLLELLVL